jgi:hypothetical protein
MDNYASYNFFGLITVSSKGITVTASGTVIGGKPAAYTANTDYADAEDDGSPERVATFGANYSPEHDAVNFALTEISGMPKSPYQLWEIDDVGNTIKAAIKKIIL